MQKQDKHRFSLKRAKDCWIKTLLDTYKNQRNKFFFHKQRKSFKKEKHLNLNNFNNRNATKTGFSSGNLAINTTKSYYLQEAEAVA